MSDVEEGPSRKLSRGRKRSSNSCASKKQGHSEQWKQMKNTEDKDWFANSFQTNKDDVQNSDCLSSTPKVKRCKRESMNNESLNTSDALFADIDIDSITSQALSQNESKSHTNIISKPPVQEKSSGTGDKHVVKSTSGGMKNNAKTFVNSKNEQTIQNTPGLKSDDTVNSSCLQTCDIETQSQYFNNQFGNYRPTQPKNRKEMVIDSKVLMSQQHDESSFSFSFIGNDTHIEGSSQKEARNDDLKESTNRGGKYRCTPYFKTDDLSVSVIESQSLPLSTNKHTAQLNLNETLNIQTQIMVPVVDSTQLKDNEGFKYRCTPYKTGPKDLCTQTQTQCELMAGTQYNSFLHESYKGTQSETQTQHKENFRVTRSQAVDSQIPCTGLINMTGVIVDTQTQEENLANTSGGDIFSDSFTDEIQPTGHCKSDSQNTCATDIVEISSHTQSLVCDKSSQSRRKRRPSFDDDIDSIMQASQNHRKKHNAVKQSASVSKSSNIKSKENEMIDESTLKIENVKSIQSTDYGKGENGDSVEKLKTEHGTSLIQEEAVSFGDKIKSGIQSNDSALLGIQSGVKLETKQVGTPGGAGSLQEKIKKRLQENAGRRTPQGPGALLQQLREQVLERVNLEAELRKEEASNEIGPFYGLPKKVQHLFETYRGITKLYDWQDECLGLPAVKERKNLIYSLPTSGGKTLVAEILILQELLCNKRDALLILPFVSIVQEKVRNMSQFAVDLGFHVEEYAGSKGRFPPIKRRNNKSLYIATIEKGQSIVNSLIETDRMDNLGLVVVDELHMLGEGGSRGSTLESTLMKILHANSTTHIIGMSATLNNIEDLKQFLNADVYSNDFRPVTLTEHVKLTESIYKVDQKARCPEDQFVHDRIVCFQYLPDMEKMDPDHILGLALEVIPSNSCLVFCPTKKNCENVALMLCKLMAKYKRELSEIKRQERKELLKELHNDSEGKMCPVLQYTIHFGVAYHHSGLTVDERKLIEEAYSDGKLCLLTCTSTLAAGVNLPAKRVILRSPYVGQYFISRSQYKQMVGRAGRAGIDSSGESILICRSSDRERVCELLAGPIESCHSSLLYDEGKGIRTLLLSAIGLKIITTTEDVFKFVRRSLAYCQQKTLCTDVDAMCRDALQRLVDSGLVIQIKSQSEDPDKQLCYSLEVTKLGKATFKGPIDPDYSQLLYKDLKIAEEPFVMSNHLHLLYLVTPYDMVKDINPSWLIYFNQMSHMNGSELKVASLIGVPESYIARRASQQKSRQKVDEFAVNRFYLTLMLYDLWKEKSVWEVAEKFQMSRGFIQNLLSNASSFASCVLHFCQELEEFWAYQDLMVNFVKRLSYCVTAELLPLMEIPGVKLGRARLMYVAGYKTLSSVSSADPEELVKAVQYMPRKVAKQIVASAKLLLNEKTEAMMEEVEALVTVPQGIRAGVTTTTTSMADTEPQTPSFSQSPVSSEVIGGQKTLSF